MNSITTPQAFLYNISLQSILTKEILIKIQFKGSCFTQNSDKGSRIQGKFAGDPELDEISFLPY